ncbi:hypothetical protein [Vulcanococcus limneticus]|uniref:hypothetical protein n=1 Tax=Vulcanococcus limneticus TaxID=2170428 RepID=UPI00398BD0DB
MQLQPTASAQDASGVETDFSAIGWELLKTDSLGPLRIGLSSDEIVKLLGNPEAKSEAKVWGADAQEHQQWIYDKVGLYFDMVTEAGEQRIAMIKASSPCEFNTSRGVGIGTDALTVMRAYKAEINLSESDTSRSIVAGSVYGGLIFSLQDGRVSSIFLGASAE